MVIGYNFRFMLCTMAFFFNQNIKFLTIFCSVTYSECLLNEELRYFHLINLSIFVNFSSSMFIFLKSVRVGIKSRTLLRLFTMALYKRFKCFFVIVVLKWKLIIKTRLNSCCKHEFKSWDNGLGLKRKLYWLS